MEGGEQVKPYNLRLFRALCSTLDGREGLGGIRELGGIRGLGRIRGLRRIRGLQLLLGLRVALLGRRGLGLHLVPCKVGKTTGETPGPAPGEAAEHRGVSTDLGGDGDTGPGAPGPAVGGGPCGGGGHVSRAGGDTSRVGEDPGKVLGSCRITAPGRGGQAGRGLRAIPAPAGTDPSAPGVPKCHPRATGAPTMEGARGPRAGVAPPRGVQAKDQAVAPAGNGEGSDTEWDRGSCVLSLSPGQGAAPEPFQPLGSVAATTTPGPKPFSGPWKASLSPQGDVGDSQVPICPPSPRSTGCHQGQGRVWHGAAVGIWCP